MTLRSRGWLRHLPVAAMFVVLPMVGSTQTTTDAPDQAYEHEETRDLVALVTDAATLVHERGEAAFSEFRVADSRWRQDETYIFVLDPQGTMLVHPDLPEGQNQLALADINGRPIIRGLIDVVTADPAKADGWYHYQWPVPGGLLPRWKSSYVRLVTAPSGSRYIIGSGMYNDRMERAFVVDIVDDAVGKIERGGASVFPLLRDPKGPFVVKDAYVFVVDPDGTDLVNPAFPTLEGRNLLDVTDAQGTMPIRKMLDLVRTGQGGWVDYMWPKPGESVSTTKSAYVRKARLDGRWVLVGCGVYLADAPRATATASKITAAELMALVRDGAALLEKDGEQAFAAFRSKDSRWFRDDTYFFVWAVDGTRVFHAADPTLEGRNDRDIKDSLGRPYGRMFLDVAASPSGEGWVHYMYPEPGSIFPAWKSAFVKRVTVPSGREYLVGSGIYNMQMDERFIEDVVDRAAALVAQRGPDAFAALRDKTGPFLFMDTYVFVDTADGVELVNPGHPAIEGKNLMGEKDAVGNPLIREYIALAMKDGSGWVDYWWYRPGQNTPARKHTYVRKVQFGETTYIVGSGVYMDKATSTTSEPR